MVLVRTTLLISGGPVTIVLMSVLPCEENGAIRPVIGVNAGALPF